MDQRVQESEANLLDLINDSRTRRTRKAANIVEFINADPEAFIRKTAKQICADVGASEPTLIRFCQGFGYAGLAEFRIDLALALVSRGGHQLILEPEASDRRSVNIEAKNIIGKKAAELVAKDRTIVIDNGSTVEHMARYLGDIGPITIVTSGLVVAQQAMNTGQHSVILTGGLIRPGALSMSGRLVENAIREMRFDTAYLGADAIDAENGLSTFLEEEAHQTRAMVNAARRVVVLADESKFSKPSLHWICDIKRVDIIVTDASPENPHIQAIARTGVEIMFAKKRHSYE